MSDLPLALVVGTGSIGERHLRCFAATGRARLAVCESNAAVRSAVANRFSLRQAFEDYRDALAARPDIVVLCTPAHLHVPMASEAAEIGAHLLIEKPLSTNLEGVEELLHQVGRRKLVAAVAYVYRCHPALIAMREAIRAGRFGTPLEIVATCGQHFPLYRPAYRDIYYNHRATGGGAVQDALTHVINAGEWLVGRIDRVVADVAHMALDGVDVEDTAHVLARHGRVLGCYSLNQHQTPNETTITVVCNRGTARFEFHRSRWRWMSEPGGAWTDEDVGPLERDTLFMRQAEALLDAAAGRREVPCSLDDAVHTLRVNLAILRSAESAAWETVAPRLTP
jgi:predicted dehydrogenase